MTLRRGQMRQNAGRAEGLLLLFLLLFGLLLVQHGAHEYLTTYFHDQVVSSLPGNAESFIPGSGGSTSCGKWSGN